MKEKIVKYPGQPPEKRKRKLVLWVFLIFLCAGGYLCLDQSFAFWEARSELQELESKRDALQAENEYLKEEILLLHENEYLEIQARRHLGMVKPGEIIFYVED